GIETGRARVAAPVSEPANVGVELVARDKAGPDPAGDGAQLPGADQRAHLVLGAVELGRNLADGQGCGPVHVRSIAELPSSPVRARVPLDPSARRARVTRARWVGRAADGAVRRRRPRSR